MKQLVDAKSFECTVEAIYDSAVSPESWSVALEQIAKLFRSQTASLHSRDLKTMNGNAVSFGADAASIREYFEVWRHRNIFVNRTKIWLPGSIETDQQIVERRDLERSDYFNDYMKRFDADWVVRLSLLTEAGLHQSISLSRHRSVGEYGPSDIKLGEMLMPHLQRAARIGWQLHRANLSRFVSTELLEENPLGIVLLDWNGQVTFANRAAKSITARADAFTIRHGTIECFSSAANKEFRGLVGGALSQIDIFNAPRGGVMRLPRNSRLRDYVVAVGSLGSGASPFGRLASAAFVLITDPDSLPQTLSSMLQCVYGATPTEARLAEQLAMDNSVEQAAEILKIKVSTARWHLASLFKKTDTTRQTELIRLLLSLPWSDGDIRNGK
jgi:DNA-binding CsgD family transcriptional regulator